ncbi:hypothetical protein [Lactococcus hircilactis]|nr:hypothetical protein [Lactococcus hircilactis]
MSAQKKSHMQSINAWKAVSTDKSELLTENRYYHKEKNRNG